MGGRLPRVGLLAMLGLLAAGCRGRAGDGAPVPVGGVVLYRNKPVETGRIVFVPGRGRPAWGTIDDGRFTLGTARESDGAIPGRHRVGVVATKEVPAGEGGGGMPRSLIPEEYSHPFTSPIEVVVPAEGLKDHEIRLP